MNDQTITCPKCDGQRRFFVVSLLCGSGPRREREEWRDCSLCSGAGQVSGTVARQWKHAHDVAEARRRDRIGRGLSVREEAARLGISPSELSRLERHEL